MMNAELDIGTSEARGLQYCSIIATQDRPFCGFYVTDHAASRPRSWIGGLERIAIYGTRNTWWLDLLGRSDSSELVSSFSFP